MCRPNLGFGANAFRILFIRLWQWARCVSRRTETSTYKLAHTHDHTLVPQTLQKWRLATIYPDSVCLLTQMHTHR